MFFEEPNYEPNHVGILKKDNIYEVLATSKRGAISGIKSFNLEEEALENFISRLESLNRLLQKNHSKVIKVNFSYYLSFSP
ncbi:Imm59 family immunity protein [Rummeliibacillus sp. TYF-LIM-RU47]|uniref:Imm59 family immunity protein n=1 Tax=Rummeliibacillus sp. TYF-LIM-RU47 TaxID=2608406 RepID=UPI0016800D8F